MNYKSPGRLIIEAIAKPIYKAYSSRSHRWSYDGMDFIVMPGIFHPGFFTTSQMLVKHTKSRNFKGKRFLELGCGCGVLSCIAAKDGAVAFASDISATGCQNTSLNADRNQLDVTVIHSDIFDHFEGVEKFDVIYANPPFREDYPDSESDFAFCCGEEHEYYTSLFGNLQQHLNPGGELIMALSKSCDIARITDIAQAEKIKFEKVQTTKKWAETNYLYRFSL